MCDCHREPARCGAAKLADPPRIKCSRMRRASAESEKKEMPSKINDISLSS